MPGGWKAHIGPGEGETHDKQSDILSVYIQKKRDPACFREASVRDQAMVCHLRRCACWAACPFHLSRRGRRFRPGRALGNLRWGAGAHEAV
jgi:hypothetical protein